MAESDLLDINHQKIVKIGSFRIDDLNHHLRVPIIARGASRISSFSLVISHNENNLEFIRLERTKLSQRFDSIIIDKKPGILVIQGEYPAIESAFGEGALVELIYRIIIKAEKPRIVELGRDLSHFLIE